MVTRLATDADAVLSFYPVWSGRMTTDHTLAIALSGEPKVAAVPVNLPPLAFTLLAEQVAWLAGAGLSAGACLACVKPLRQALATAAWSRGVSRLAAPQPSLAQHLRSLAGASFFVSVLPSPSVRPASRTVLSDTGWLDRPLAGKIYLDGDARGARWFARSISGHLSQQRVGQAADRIVVTSVTAGHREEYYGTERSCEIALTAADLRDLAARARALTLPRCGWCGQGVPAMPCAFCGSGTAPRADP